MRKQVAALSDDALTWWIALLNTEIDMVNAGEACPIPLAWLEERCAEAYAEQETREEARLVLAS